MGENAIMTHRTHETDIGVASQRNFIECAQVCEAAANYQESILPKAESILEELCILDARNRFLADARRFRELAVED